MALTVGWLLSQAGLRLTLAAGSAGVDREIRWAHAIELGDPTPWLSGGELVLTTGMRLPRATVLRPAQPPSASASVSHTIGYRTACWRPPRRGVFRFSPCRSQCRSWPSPARSPIGSQRIGCKRSDELSIIRNGWPEQPSRAVWRA